jgi:hypothetical protein
LTKKASQFLFFAFFYVLFALFVYCLYVFILFVSIYKEMARGKCIITTDVNGNPINSFDRRNRLKVGPGSAAARASKGGKAVNAAITRNPQNKSTGVCGCRSGPVSSSFFNST